MYKNSSDVYEIVSESGLEIKATSDHPFLTGNGMKKVSELSKGDELGVNLFEGIEFNEKIDEKLAITTKILGYMFGDGCLYYSGKRGFAAVYGQKEDLETFRQRRH